MAYAQVLTRTPGQFIIRRPMIDIMSEQLETAVVRETCLGTGHVGTSSLIAYNGCIVLFETPSISPLKAAAHGLFAYMGHDRPRKEGILPSLAALCTLTPDIKLRHHTSSMAVLTTALQRLNSSRPPHATPATGPLRNFQLILLDRLSRPMGTQQAAPVSLPVELVIKILEYVLLEDEPVIISSTAPLPLLTRNVALVMATNVDPYMHRYSELFNGHFVFETRGLGTIARDAYYNVNMIQMHGEDLARGLSFATNIRRLELTFAYMAEPTEPWWYTGTFDDMCYSNPMRMRKSDVDDFEHIIRGLQGISPKLTEMVVVMAVVPPVGKKHDLPCVHDGLCCVLLNQKSTFRSIWATRVAPLLQTLETKFVAFKWLVLDCKHTQCKEFAKGSGETQWPRIVETEIGDEHCVAILK
ncbi:hypothetical protein LTS10_010017 [Elasticomyces elasticus]|nr:hypothetical protein LTS10_010017 [Elasticomyces elasticus]